MRETSLFFGLFVAVSGALLVFLSPPGLGTGALGAGFCCAGCLLVGVWYYLGQDVPRRQNTVRSLVFLAGAAAAFSGFVAVMVYLGEKERPGALLSSILGYAGMAGGVLAMIYGFRYHINSDLLQLAAEIGFAPADSGLTRPDGRYDLRGTVNGVEVLLDGSTYEATRNNRHSIALDVRCRVANTAGVRVAAYPGGLGGRPLKALPPSVEHVPYWDWHSVHSEPPDAAERLLAGARSIPNTVFQDKYGFKFLEINGNELTCTFGREGYFTAQYLRAIVTQAAALAAKVA